MKHSYFFLTFIVFFLFSVENGMAQDVSSVSGDKEKIEGLSVFPNPTTNGTSTIFITSKSNAIKKVSIYNVLGKQIAATVSTRRELNISSLNSGVYILKIAEGSAIETRKLVIK